MVEPNGELSTDPAESRTHDTDASPRTSGNDLFVQLLGKAKDACLQKNLEIFLIGNPVEWCSSTMFIRHCWRMPLIGWRKSGRTALGQPGT